MLDPVRTPIGGAQVTAISPGHTSGPSVVSDQNGEFSLPLDPGAYIVKVAKDGFAENSQMIHILQDGSEPRDIVLQVSPVRSAVTVTEDAGYLVKPVARRPRR